MLLARFYSMKMVEMSIDRPLAFIVSPSTALVVVHLLPALVDSPRKHQMTFRKVTHFDAKANDPLCRDV
jgi:hypothetical protein